MEVQLSQQAPFSVLNGATEKSTDLPFAAVIKTFLLCSEFGGD